MWHRVFARSAESPTPSALAAHLHEQGHSVEPHFRGDDLGWTSGDLLLPGNGGPVTLNRYLTTEDDIRAELNAFAAELELMTFNPHHAVLMQHVVQAQQLVTLRRPLDHADEARLDRLCLEVLQLLATSMEGIYQIDGRGWFAAAGDLLIPDY